MMTAFFASHTGGQKSLTFSTGTPWIFVESAYFSTVFFRSSKPLVRFLMYSLSSRPSLMIQYIMELASAMWVDGFERDPFIGNLCRCTFPRVNDNDLDPLLLCLHHTPGSKRVGLDCVRTHMTIRSEFRTSSNGLVAAPDPNDRERPATDGPWQIRAQLSTLFVWKATRAHFCRA